MFLDRKGNGRNNFSYEVLLIDDGSKDKSWVIEKLKSDNSNLKGIKFRRNYGKSTALNVAFSKTKMVMLLSLWM